MATQSTWQIDQIKYLHQFVSDEFELNPSAVENTSPVFLAHFFKVLDYIKGENCDKHNIEKLLMYMWIYDSKWETTEKRLIHYNTMIEEYIKTPLSTSFDYVDDFVNNQEKVVESKEFNEHVLKQNRYITDYLACMIEQNGSMGTYNFLFDILNPASLLFGVMMYMTEYTNRASTSMSLDVWEKSEESKLTALPGNFKTFDRFDYVLMGMIDEFLETKLGTSTSIKNPDRIRISTENDKLYEGLRAQKQNMDSQQQ